MWPHFAPWAFAAGRRAHGLQISSQYAVTTRRKLCLSTLAPTRAVLLDVVAPDIHPSAFVHQDAYIGPGVTVGPFCTVGARVRLGANSRLASHVVIEGQTSIGENCEFASFCVVGGEPQDKKHDKHNPAHVRASELRMGSGCTVREYVTVNCGTAAGGGATVVGDGVWLLANSHVAHDCVVGDNVVVSNGTQLGGHVRVGAGAVLGGMVGVRQRVHIGRLAMVGAGSLVSNHVPPFSLVVGNRARVRGVNIRGLKRNGIRRRLILDLCSQFRAWYGSQSHRHHGKAPSGVDGVNLDERGRRRHHRERELLPLDESEEGNNNNVLFAEFVDFVAGDTVKRIDHAADGLGCCAYYLQPQQQQ